MAKYYSKQIPKILETKRRNEVGIQILTVLKKHVGDLSSLKILDYGCSSGAISNILAQNVKKVVGIDIDKPAIKFAQKKFKRKNLVFYLINSTETGFKDESFDVIIANQVYNFVANDKALMREIHRLLKVGGICYFGARNKYAIIEPQYNIPFLSWIPKRSADLIVRALNLGDEFIGKYRSYYELKELIKSFKMHDYTFKILSNPNEYKFVRLAKYKQLIRLIPLRFLKPFIPNYIWILEK